MAFCPVNSGARIRTARATDGSHRRVPSFVVVSVPSAAQAVAAAHNNIRQILFIGFIGFIGFMVKNSVRHWECSSGNGL